MKSAESLFTFQFHFLHESNHQHSHFVTQTFHSLLAFWNVLCEMQTLKLVITCKIISKPGCHCQTEKKKTVGYSWFDIFNIYFLFIELGKCSLYKKCQQNEKNIKYFATALKKQYIYSCFIFLQWYTSACIIENVDYILRGGLIGTF